MSKYMINKFMRAVELSDVAVAAYIADTEGFVDNWLAGGAGPDQRADERALTREERQAFIDRDEGELFRLGAHPYLLWHFIESVWVHEVPWKPLVERYRANVKKHEPVDFIT